MVESEEMKTIKKELEENKRQQAIIKKRFEEVFESQTPVVKSTVKAYRNALDKTKRDEGK